MTEGEPREVVCPASGGKVRHASRDAARAALADARAIAGARRYRKLPRSAYRCPLCTGWPGRRRHI